MTLKCSLGVDAKCIRKMTEYLSLPLLNTFDLEVSPMARWSLQPSGVLIWRCCQWLGGTDISQATVFKLLAIPASGNNHVLAKSMLTFKNQPLLPFSSNPHMGGDKGQYRSENCHVPAEGIISRLPSQAILSDFVHFKFRPAILTIQRFRRVAFPCCRSQSLVEAAAPRGCSRPCQY
jgi:hypothetical protein